MEPDEELPANPTTLLEAIITPPQDQEKHLNSFWTTYGVVETGSTHMGSRFRRVRGAAAIQQNYPREGLPIGQRATTLDRCPSCNYKTEGWWTLAPGLVVSPVCCHYVTEEAGTGSPYAITHVGKLQQRMGGMAWYQFDWKAR